MAHIELYDQKQKYITNPQGSILGPRNYVISTDFIKKAVEDTQKKIEDLMSFDINIFELLGMRNLSGLIGEIFVSVCSKNSQYFMKNPHQDGYPDILLLDDIGKQKLLSVSSLKDKSPFSPFQTGGFEVKATCGSTPTPTKCKELGCLKPEIGDQRITMVKSYDWKAHHRNTNYLFGIFWDFLDGVPTIVAIFYSNQLDTNDWTKVVKPKNIQSRTTSVSMLKRDGVRKMYNNWLVMINQNIYTTFFYRYNKTKKLKKQCK